MESRDYLPDVPCICINLRRLSQKATEFYDQALKSVGISVNQYSLLVSIGRLKGCGTGQLARYVKLEKSTLVRTLQPLFRDGLIIDKSSDDTRKRRIYLTASAVKILKKAYPLWQKAQEDIAAEFGMSYGELTGFLNKLNLWK